MNRTITFFLVLFSSLIYAQTGEKNFIDQNYIEVTGSAEMEITPDQIFLKIILNEKDIKSKSVIEELEISMIRKLIEMEIDVKRDLTVIDLASNFRYYFIKENKIYLSKEYELMIKDANTAGKVIQELELLGISNVTISKVDHSTIEKYKKEVKINAIKAAKEKAESLVSEINQSIGKAIFIKEMDNIQVMDRLSGKVSGVYISNITVRGSSSTSVGDVPLEIEFEKIKLQYSILVRFELQ